MSIQHAQYVLLCALLVLVVNSNRLRPHSDTCSFGVLAIHVCPPRSTFGCLGLVPKVDLGGHFWLPKVELG